MSDIKIQREHDLGIDQARQLTRHWMEERGQASQPKPSDGSLIA